jgi:hypothetical protein
MTKKTAKQLDAEITAALARPPSRSFHAARAGTMRAGKIPDPKKTLKEIALAVFPNYKGRKIRLEEADHVDRQVEGGGTFYRDYLVNLSPAHMHAQPIEQPGAFRGTGTKQTNIRVGFAYVSHGVFQGQDTGIRIYLPSIDSDAMSVAVDAVLAAGGKITPAVLTVIENALTVPGENRLRNAYVALVAQRAGALSSAEASAGYG